MKKHDATKRIFIKKSLLFSAGVLCHPYHQLLADRSAEDDRIYKKLAMYQEETARGIMCRICPNECVLKEGAVSECRNRKVHNSKLYTMAYGNPCSANIDPIEKKPVYHFYPGTRAFSIATAGCNLACLNCQNWTISQTSPDKTRNYDLPPNKVVEECKSSGCKSIAYTYSEPTTFFEYAYDTAVVAREAGIKNVVKSNGYINPEPLKKLCTVIDAANIDLKSFNDNTYLRLTGGRLQPVLDSLKIYKDMGVWLEITYLVVPTWSDDLQEIRMMCQWLNKNGFSKTPIHFSRFYPVHKLEQLPPTPLVTLNKASSIAYEEGLQYVYTGNVPGHELSDTRCPSCKAVLIKREGFRIASNNIREGKCNKCGQIIDGVWN
jgi:pyruvate formate lyase activating enzyme